MSMTKEEISTRIAELKRRQEDALADLNALGGAIQDCEFWLNRLKMKEEEEKNQSESPPNSIDTNS